MIQLENLLLLDIETVPEVNQYTQLDEQKQKLWDRKSYLLDKDNEDTAMVFEERAGIYAEFGKIICISVGYFIREESEIKFKVKSIAHHSEQEVLHQFIKVCSIFFKGKDKKFCGHNIREFDIPYICRRCFINQIPLPQILTELQEKKPWESPLVDTLHLWKFGEYKNFTSINLLAHVLKIESPKNDIDGSEVARVYWIENDLKRIATYCSRDVVTVAQVMLRLHSLPLIENKNIIYID